MFWKGNKHARICHNEEMIVYQALSHDLFIFFIQQTKSTVLYMWWYQRILSTVGPLPSAPAHHLKLYIYETLFRLREGTYDLMHYIIQLYRQTSVVLGPS
jgi:hypothetical protein